MKLIDNFKRFIEYANIEIVDINSESAEQAAIIRGQFRYFKAMDSLQIAAALASTLAAVQYCLCMAVSGQYPPAFR